MKKIAKSTVEAIVRLIENANQEKESFSQELNPNAVAAVVSNDGKIACSMDIALWGDDAEALRLMTILSYSVQGVYPTNELDNASRDIAREVFGQNVKRVLIWTRRQCKYALLINIGLDEFDEDVERTKRLFNLIDELYDNGGFIVTGTY